MRTYATFISKKRFIFLCASISFLFVCIAANLCYLHLAKSAYCKEKIEAQRNRTVKIDARRGDILDYHGNILASTYPYIEVGVDPEVFDCQDEEKLSQLTALLSISRKELFEKAKKDTYMSEDGSEVKCVRWRKISPQIDEMTYQKIVALNVKGIRGDRKYKRSYPSGALTSHAVGFVNRDFDAEFGIEKLSDYYLRGQDGWMEIERDGRRRELTQFRGREQSAIDGMDVQTSIDIIIQEAAQNEMKNLVEKYNPASACILVSEASTGFIVGMVSYPNFDPNNYGNYPLDSMRNRAISDRFEPGSTFKIVPVAAALNESLVGAEDTFDCTSSTATYKGRILKLSKEAHDFDKHLTVREIVSKSSNRGSARIGMLLGENKLFEYASLFGFGSKTGIALLGEVSGALPKVERWDSLTITRMPMGHAVDATPLQIHCAMSVIANGGIYMQPQIIRKIISKEDNKSIVFQPKALRRVISPKTSSLMCEMLVSVTEKGGTATRAALDGFKVAGKTGTSQKIVNGHYVTNEHVASFSGFFPAQRPRLIITIIVDNPRGKGIGYGGSVAAPVFSNLAKTAASYLGIQNDIDAEKSLAWKN